MYPCPFCGVYFSTQSLKNHIITCLPKTKIKEEKNVEVILIHSDSNDDDREILDEVKDIKEEQLEESQSERKLTTKEISRVSQRKNIILLTCSKCA